MTGLQTLQVYGGAVHKATPRYLSGEILTRETKYNRWLYCGCNKKKQVREEGKERNAVNLMG